MIDEPIRSRLELGANKLGIPIDEYRLDQFCDYLALLKKWNKAYNLTALKSLEQMLGLHLLDSLAVIPYIKGKHILDVGTGAGLPGIIIAIQKPDVRMTLLDSNGKKTRFLNQVKAELDLANVEVIHSRVEKFRPEELFDSVLSRAFASLKDMTDNAAHLLAEGGRFWAMKGRYPQQEIESLGSMYTLESCQALQIPGVDAERHLIELSVPKENLD